MAAPIKDQRLPWQEPKTPSAGGFAEAAYACFRLHPSAAAISQGFVRLLARTPDGADRLCIAPAFAATPLIVIDPARSAGLRYHQDDASIEAGGVLARVSLRLRATKPSYARTKLKFEGAALYPEGDRASVRNYRKLIKFAQASNMSFDGDAMRHNPGLALGFAELEPARRDSLTRPGPATAVVLHLHYFELWPEIVTLLKRWRSPFQLFVTLTRDDDVFARGIAADFPDAKVAIVENKGRDIRPFLQLLESGALDAYELVCKIHGKRSLRAGVSPLFGEMFRRAALFDLIGDDAQIERVQTLFASEPELGLVGPERFRARSRHGDPAEVMGASRATIEALARRMGAEIAAGEYDVFHGTMFWARPRALAKLRALGLAQDGFAPEGGREDGALEHAVEGVFNLAVRSAGFKVAGATF